MPSKSISGWHAAVPMKKLLNKPWFAAVLALAAVLLVGNSLLTGGKGSTGKGGASNFAANSTSLETEGATEEVSRVPAGDALKALVIRPSALRDPFAQPTREEVVVTAEKTSLPDLVDTVHLSALWTQSGATFTLINDRICQAGDEIGRLKIESATQEGVWITHWKGRDFLALGGDFTLKTPANKSGASAAASL